MTYTLAVNGAQHTIDVEGDTPLLWVLRDTLNLKGAKFGCGAGLCGACTVHINGVAMRSCQMPVASLDKAKITTIEGLGETSLGKRLQTAWIETDAPQCGYCQTGQIMSAASLLAKNSAPSDADIDSAMNGNICRCGTYNRIRKAIKQAANATSSSALSPAHPRKGA